MESNILNKYKKERFLAIIALFVIFVINLPYLILGDNFYPQFGYDNLDSNIIIKKLLIDSENIFSKSSEIIEQPLSGIPRIAFGSEFSITNLLHYLFDTPVAYVVNVLLIQLSGFIGMILFLRKKYARNSIFIIYSVALIFSQLPFWPNAGISLAGIPLLFYAYLIFGERKTLSLSIVILYILYSSFVLTGIFLICLFWMFVFYKIATKTKYKNLLIFTSIFTILYPLTEYRLIIFMLNPLFISHRSELVKSIFSVNKSMSVFGKILFTEYGHNVKKPFIISFTAIIVIFLANIKKLKIHKDVYKYCSIIVLLAFFSVAAKTEIGLSLSSIIKPLEMIQLQRFYWLLPPLFYILFFLVLREIWKTKFKVLVFILLVIQFGLIFQKNTNFKQFIKTEVLKKEAGVLSFNEFYSKDLYLEINDYIGKPQDSYRVVSVGLQPAVALYNGFYTLDGYFPNYPLNYKHKFFELIEPELKKNDVLLNRYQQKGSVVIVLSNEIIERRKGRDFVIPYETKDIPDRIIDNLQLNTDVLNELNCQYIFSSAEIVNHLDLKLKYEKYFERDDSPWGIFLYSYIVD